MHINARSVPSCDTKAIRSPIILKPPLGTLKDLPTNSSNSGDNQYLTPQEENIFIPDIGLVVTVTDTGKYIPKQLLDPPVEVYIFPFKKRNPQINRTGKKIIINLARQPFDVVVVKLT